MTNALYTRAAATATRLLTAYGQTITHTPYTTGTYDSDTGTVAPTPSPASRIGALLDFGAGQTEERGTLILSGDKRLLLDSSAPAPNPRDRFTIGGVVYGVVSVGEINPAGTPVLYDLHVRVA